MNKIGSTHRQKYINTYINTYIHKYIHTYLLTYIHTAHIVHTSIHASHKYCTTHAIYLNIKEIIYLILYILHTSRRTIRLLLFNNNEKHLEMNRYLRVLSASTFIAATRMQPDAKEEAT